jgi:hypothetical protein
MDVYGALYVLLEYCQHQGVCIICVLQYSKDHALQKYGILRAMSCVPSINTFYTRERIFCVLRYSKDRALCVLHEYCLHQGACSVLYVLHEYCLHEGAYSVLCVLH